MPTMTTQEVRDALTDLEMRRPENAFLRLVLGDLLEARERLGILEGLLIVAWTEMERTARLLEQPEVRVHYQHTAGSLRNCVRQIRDELGGGG